MMFLSPSIHSLQIVGEEVPSRMMHINLFLGLFFTGPYLHYTKY